MREAGGLSGRALKPLGRRAGALLLLVSALPGSAGAAEPAIRVEGGKRTKPAYVRHLVLQCLEEQGGEGPGRIDGPALEQCLMNSELFTDVHVTAGEVLTVAVEDRWTLIPLPFFRSQEDSTSAGGVFMESNFLGLGQLLVLGATFGSLGNSYFFMLRDPSIGFTDWTSRAMYVQDSSDIFRYRGEVKTGGYRRKERVLSLSPGYRFTPHVEGRAVVEGTWRDFEEKQPFGTPPENYRFWSAGAGVEIDAADYKFYYSEGHRLEAEIRRQFARSGEGGLNLAGEVEWDWQRPFPGRNVFKLALEGMAVDSGAAVDSFQLGGERSLRGVQEKGLWARYLAGVVVDYHFPLREGSFGTWAGGPFVAYALYRPPEGYDRAGWEDSVAYGAGLFFYLKKVAFPGIGIVAGRNPDFSGNFVTVQIGFSK